MRRGDERGRGGGGRELVLVLLPARDEGGRDHGRLPAGGGEVWEGREGEGGCGGGLGGQGPVLRIRLGLGPRGLRPAALAGRLRLRRGLPLPWNGEGRGIGGGIGSRGRGGGIGIGIGGGIGGGGHHLLLDDAPGQEGAGVEALPQSLAGLLGGLLVPNVGQAPALAPGIRPLEEGTAPGADDLHHVPRDEALFPLGGAEVGLLVRGDQGAEGLVALVAVRGAPPARKGRRWDRAACGRGAAAPGGGADEDEEDGEVDGEVDRRRPCDDFLRPWENEEEEEEAMA